MDISSADFLDTLAPIINKQYIMTYKHPTIVLSINVTTPLNGKYWYVVKCGETGKVTEII